jgi:hypothetical protein
MKDRIEKLTIMGAGRLLKAFRTALLAVGMVAWASLVPPLMADEIFPSDGRAPQPVDAELLRAVCPGQLDGSVCRGGCDNWDLKIVAVTRGHFLSPTSEDAVLSTDDPCGSPAESNGATILLTRRSQRWKMLWNNWGVNTARCHKVMMRDRREILVCIDNFSHHGVGSTGVHAEDLINDSLQFGWTEPGVYIGGHTWPRGDFFALPDNSFCCTEGPPVIGFPLTWGSVEKVEFATDTAGGPPPISVTASFGKGVWTAEAIRFTAEGIGHDRSALQSAAPLKRYRIDFVFDGQDYKPTPASAATAKIFADQR